MRAVFAGILFAAAAVVVQSYTVPGVRFSSTRRTAALSLLFPKVASATSSSSQDIDAKITHFVRIGVRMQQTDATSTTLTTTTSTKCVVLGLFGELAPSR